MSRTIPRAGDLSAATAAGVSANTTVGALVVLTATASVKHRAVAVRDIHSLRHFGGVGSDGVVVPVFCGLSFVTGFSLSL